MCPHASLVAKLCLTLWPHGFLCPRNSPGKNTGVGCHFLLQGIFCSKGSNLVSCIFCIGRWILYHWASPQFSSVAQSCPTICDPMDCSTPGFPVHHQHLELTQTHIHHVSDAIQPSHPLSSPSPPASNPSHHQGGQSIGVSASASVLPMNTQDWSPSGWTGWISLLSKDS